MKSFVEEYHEQLCHVCQKERMELECVKCGRPVCYTCCPDLELCVDCQEGDGESTLVDTFLGSKIF